MGRILTTMGVFAVAVGLSSCKGASDTPVGRMAVVGPAKLRDAVRLSGTVQPVVQVELKAEVSGRIIKLPTKEGAMVKKGDLLVELDPVPFQLKVDRAQLVVDRMRLAVSTAKRDLSRSTALAATGTVSPDAVVDLETALKKAELDLRDADLQLKESAKDFSDAHVRAPMNGQLISLKVEEGEMVASAVSLSGGTTMGVVADPAKMKVVVEVGELDYPRLRLGMPVEVSSGSDGTRALKGSVTFISSSARASTASASIQVFPVEVTLNSDTGSGKEKVEGEGRSKGAGGGHGAPGASDSQGRGGVHQRRDSAVAGASEGAGKGNDSAKGGKRDRKGASGESFTLVAGMTVAVDFVFMEREAPIAVLQSAIQKGKESTVLVRTADGKTESRKVRTGATDFRHIEILEGLVAGDSVLVPESASATKKPGGGGPGGH